jgi:hypothetical protein
MKKLFLTLFLFTNITKALSFPIEQQTLKSLIENSPYIIEGFVINIETIKHQSKSDSLTRAKIKILKTFKGNITAQYIFIYFMPNLICPMPDNYEKNTKVLCFLDTNLDKKIGGYFAPGLSYASKYISNDVEEKFYEKRITEYLNILTLSNQTNQDYETTEWLVKCAENALTRYDATTDLLKKFDYEKNKESIDYSKLLSKSQKERLFNCFVNSATRGHNALLALINGVDDEKLLLHLKKLAHTIKAPNWLDGNPYIYWIGVYTKKDYSVISENLTENLGSMKYNTPEDQKRMEHVYTNFLKLIDEEEKN